MRILDVSEANQIKCPPKKIVIQHGQEVFLRQLTHICIAGEALGKAIVIFSWEPRPASSETDHLSTDVLTAPAPTDDAFIAVTVSRNLHGLLQSIAHGRSTNSVIQELYEASQYQQFKAEEGTSEASQDRSIILIAISKGMFDILEKLSNGRSTDTVIRELYQTYLTKHAEGVGPRD